MRETASECGFKRVRRASETKGRSGGREILEARGGARFSLRLLT
jgi:hypothetical protein